MPRLVIVLYSSYGVIVINAFEIEPTYPQNILFGKAAAATIPGARYRRGIIMLYSA